MIYKKDLNFELNINIIHIIHKCYNIQLKNKIKKTANTKTRSEISGGGRKPWKQKGTGNARAGSIRSPLWKGGGIIFGPKHIIVSKKINKKEKNLALISCFHMKKFTFIIVEKLESLIEYGSSLFILKFFNQFLKKLKNIQKLKNKLIFLTCLKNKMILFNKTNIKAVSNLTIELLLNFKYILFSENILKSFN